MQHTTGVAVVATQLADTDRRALSQAWYSALHLADHPPAAGNAQRTHVPCPSPSPPSRCGRDPGDVALRRAADRGTLARGAARDVRSLGGSSTGAERRLPKTELARRIERGLTRQPARSAASFAVRSGNGRVHLVVRADGALTRIVAVCAPPLRERVERALAHARFALAARGVRAEVA